jgi:hypothetical protein
VSGGQLALDPDAGVRIVGDLQHVDEVVRSTRPSLIKPPIGFPPVLAATTMAEQVEVLAGLEAGRAVTEGVRRTLAQRVLLFITAGGGSLSAKQLGVLSRGMAGSDELALFRGVGKARNFLGHIADVGDVMATVMRRGPSAIKNLVKKNSAFSKGLKVLKKAVKFPVAQVAGVVVSFKEAYDKSSAQSGVGRLTSATLSTMLGAAKMAGPPGKVFAVLDWAAGDVVQGSVDVIITVTEAGVGALAGDPHAGDGLNQMMQDAHDGKKGWFYQAVQGEGEMFAAVGASFVVGNSDPLTTWSDEARAGRHGPVMRAGQAAGDWMGGGLYDLFN